MLKGVVFAYDYVAGVEEEEPVTEDPKEEEEEPVKETIVKISCTSEAEAEELVKKLKDKIAESSDVFISYVS